MHRWIVLVATLACVAGVLLGASPSWAEDIVVIVNRSGPLVRLTRDDVRALYLGERSFVGRDKVSVIHLPEGPVKETFLRAVTDMALKDYKLHWIRRMFQDGTPLPTVLSDPADVVKEVATNRASLGYVPENAFQDAAGAVVLFRVSAP